MPSPGGTSSSRTSGARFAATRWSIVLAAADERSPTASRRALEELVQAYWFPLYAFIRRQGNDPQSAEDFTQGFFAHLLENDGLTTVDRTKGKFRSFLLASAKNFLADERARAGAKKRGGDRQVVSLDSANAEALYANDLADTMTPERLFERNWALAVLNHVVTRLEREYAARGKSAIFSALRHFLDGQADDESYAGKAKELGTSEGALRVAAHRLRRRYRELLREEITQTVAGPELVDEEIRFLLQCL